MTIDRIGLPFRRPCHFGAITYDCRSIVGEKLPLLIDPQKGEQTAQACANACLQQLTQSFP